MSSTDDIMVCANCGKGEESSNDLKACTACKMVKYCNRDCQIAHRPQHKKVRVRLTRAAELHEDEQLFKDPPPREECPICMLPLPIDAGEYSFKSCCGKLICAGCIVSMTIEEMRKGKNNDEIVENSRGLGIVTSSSSSRSLRGCSQASDERLDLLEEEDKDDDDFDHETEDPEEDSDMDMEENLAKEKIAKDELDALSVTSNVDDSDEEGEDTSDGGGDSSSESSNDKEAAIRRSKRKRFTLSKSDGSNDIGTLDTANIVRGKRKHAPVDYRKLADAMFGDDPDDDSTRYIPQV